MFTEPRRRLAAILAADVAGYSRLMAVDEDDTLDMLNRSRALFRGEIDQHGGRVVDMAGDSVLAIFDSVVEAIAAALVIQAALDRLNVTRPVERRMLFRIGINLGDVLQQTDGSIYGDGVNIAARLEALATPGSIALAGPAYDFVADRADAQWRFLGEQTVKNIARPVRVYVLAGGGAAPEEQPGDAAASTRAPASTAPQRLPARPSIAVLPFNNMSGQAAEDYFADGITEDIITELSRFKDLVVTSRNSTFSYKDRSVKAQDVGRELNVRYILEGSVRKAGDRVRVNAQLIDAADGHHLWAERFDRRLEDVFAVQDELTRRIVATLVDRLSDSERRRARSEAPSSDPAAYDLVLKGRELWLRFNREDNLAARGLYLQAIKLDPEYARAYAGMAWTYAMAYSEYWTDDPVGALDCALDYARRGVHMDPTAHNLRLCLGMVYFFRGELAAAIECCEKAVELNPNDADSHLFLARALCFAGEPERALVLLDHAFAINPYLDDWARSIYVLAYFVAERYAEGATRARDLHNAEGGPARWCAVTLAMQGELEIARDYAVRYLARYPAFDLDEHVRRTPFARAADRERYATALRRAGFAARAGS